MNRGIQLLLGVTLLTGVVVQALNVYERRKREDLARSVRESVARGDFLTPKIAGKIDCDVTCANYQDHRAFCDTNCAKLASRGVQSKWGEVMTHCLFKCAGVADAEQLSCREACFDEVVAPLPLLDAWK